jgi:hypothetical protein
MPKDRRRHPSHAIHTPSVIAHLLATKEKPSTAYQPNHTTTMMMKTTSPVLVLVLAVATTSAFTASSSFFASPPARTFTASTSTFSSRRVSHSRRYMAQLVEWDDEMASGVVGEECNITPEGFGFTTPTSRVLTEAKRGAGFHRAAASDLVIDVMEAITTGEQDVALVFDTQGTGKLLGLFTEMDYIKVRGVEAYRAPLLYHMSCNV